MTKEFYSNGKLLLTGEYAVLDGALSLAVPTSFGQSLKISEIETPQLVWRSLDEEGKIWFETIFELDTFFSAYYKSSSEDSITDTLLKILREAKKLNPDFLEGNGGYAIETSLDFPRDWGLGSSSTLINNIAQWADVDAFELLWNAFSGSGYDIACAQNETPVLYQLENEKPIVKKVDFNPPFAEHLYFIHLGKKQNSREGIAQYRKMEFNSVKLIREISGITEKVLSCSTLIAFEGLLQKHEQLISETLQLPTVHDFLFPDYKGTIKSLGAWGGDFILATGNASTPPYFKKKGYSVVLPYSKMVL